MAWATTADVLSLTGRTVTEDQITQAQGIIDLYSGVTEAASENLKARDIELLRKATSYQAAWMSRQIDTFTRMDVSDASQDSTSFTTANEDTMVLAPLANRALARLTWRKSKSVQIQAGRPVYSLRNLEHRFLRDQDDCGCHWRPL